jgi:hypothetical protein
MPEKFLSEKTKTADSAAVQLHAWLPGVKEYR